MLVGIYKALLPIVRSTKKIGVFIVVLTVLFQTIVSALPTPWFGITAVNAVL